jgi:importin subunit alpha-2
VTPALRAVGNIVTGSDHQTQLVLDCGALSHFNNLLTHPRSNIQKEAAWTISNITAGQPSQIQSVIDMQLIPHLLQIMARIIYILEANALKPLCDLLVVKDAKIVQVLLDGLLNILNAASKRRLVDQVCLMIEECEGLDKIEALQQHSNQDVYKLSLTIIDKFFSEEEEEDQSIAPTVNSTGGFQFAPAVQSVPSGGFSF